MTQQDILNQIDYLNFTSKQAAGNIYNLHKKDKQNLQVIIVILFSAVIVLIACLFHEGKGKVSKEVCCATRCDYDGVIDETIKAVQFRLKTNIKYINRGCIEVKPLLRMIDSLKIDNVITTNKNK